MAVLLTISWITADQLSTPCSVSPVLGEVIKSASQYRHPSTADVNRVYWYFKTSNIPSHILVFTLIRFFGTLKFPEIRIESKCLCFQTMTDVVGNPEEERRAEFYYQPWAQEAVCRYFYSKVIHFLPTFHFLSSCSRHPSSTGPHFQHLLDKMPKEADKCI